MTKEQLDLLNEISDSLPDLIDVARGLKGGAKKNVIAGLELIQAQIGEVLILEKNK